MNTVTSTRKTLLPLVLLGTGACVERWHRPSDETLNQRYAATVTSTRHPGSPAS